jgi:hypothetical protein
VNEASLQAAVVDLAHAYSFKAAHFRPAQTAKGWRTPVGGDGRGFVDLVLAKPGRVLFVELKADAGRLTAQQKEWVEVLDAKVWRPADWHSGEILRVLSGSEESKK